MQTSGRRVLGYVGLALVAFAANSVLCRQALLRTAMDPLSFTLVRLGSGALTLAVLARSARARALGPGRTAVGQVLDGAWLLLYALPFSLAYRRLETGAGALLLFGSVQLTLMASAVLQGERPSVREWGGLAGAFGGLVYLVSPGLHAPDALGALAMAASGVGWGLYTLAGRHSGGSPIRRNARSFALAALAMLVPALGAFHTLHFDPRGVVLAVASGSTASAIGYAIWYAALPQISTTRAALAQLLVPVIAAFGGVILLGEHVTARLLVASVVVLGALAWSQSARR